jgi:hypothetical protein
MALQIMLTFYNFSPLPISGKYLFSVMFMKCYYIRPINSLTIGLGLLLGTASAQGQFLNIIVGPFADNGRYNLVTGGDFEAPLNGWQLEQFRPGLGQANIAATHALYGASSLQLTALETFSSPGFALRSEPVTLSAGISYTLSGFILTPSTPLHGATIYFDLNDSPNENPLNGQTEWYESGQVPIGGLSQWHFVWSTYTPSNTISVIPRVCVDVGGNVGVAFVDAGDMFFIDEMALTETSVFQAPTAIPEPKSFGICVAIGLVGFSLVSRNHRKPSSDR